MSYQLRFHGAAKAVTGSCFVFTTDRSRVAIDCGMFQGSKTEKELNYRSFPFEPARLDAVILTHAHIDHAGLIPKLTTSGFTGPIFATEATVDLCSIMLPDSGAIQEMECEQLNRRNARRGRPPVVPIYTAEDAVRAMAQFRSVGYRQWTVITEDVRARFWNAGHLLGSASVELEVANGTGEPLRILFSGDIGPDGKLLQLDPEAPTGFDHVVCEATYGDFDRQDASMEKRRALLCDEVLAARKFGGVLLIPSFAVERTQELLVDLVALMEQGVIPQSPVFIDSPLASRASAIFAKHASELEDGDALRRALVAPNVKFTESVELSRGIDRIRNFYIVIAASGMCEAGRIRHHLRAWLWRRATVLLVGFQAQGTLGRILQDGASRVRIMGEEIQVRARIRRLDVYSGHADRSELRAWLEGRLPVRSSLFLVHGEESALTAMKAWASDLLPDIPVIVPDLDDSFDLTTRHARPMVPSQARRLEQGSAGQRDWHNELSKLFLDIGERIEQAADARAKAVLVRRLRRALDPDE